MDSALDILLCNTAIVLFLAINAVRLVVLRKRMPSDAENALERRKLISFNLWLSAAIGFLPLMALFGGFDGVLELWLYFGMFVRFEYLSLVLINVVFVCILAVRTISYVKEKVPEQKQNKKIKLIKTYIFMLVLLAVVDVTSLLLMGRMLTFVIVSAAVFVCICIKTVSYIKSIIMGEQYSVKRVAAETVSAMMIIIVPVIIVFIWYIVQVSI